MPADSDLSSSDDETTTTSTQSRVPVRATDSNASDDQRRGLRRRHWMVTYYPDSEEECMGLDGATMAHIIEDTHNRVASTKLVYMVWQIEKCPGTGKLHLQGYMEFEKNVFRRYVQRFFRQGYKLHTEARYGTREDCIKYCTKEETRVKGPWEYGNRNHAAERAENMGRRTDIQKIHEAINGGYTMDDLMREFPADLIRMCNGVKTAMSVVRKRDAPLDRDIKVVVIFGGTGTGKTSGVLHGLYERHKIKPYTVDSTMLSTSGTTIWWDGYENEDHVLWDEYHNWIPTGDLLRYMDRYTMQIQKKGGSTVAYYKRLYITTNLPPWEWKDPSTGKLPVPEHRAAIIRRMDTIVQLVHGMAILHKRNGVVLNKKTIGEYTGEEPVLDDYAKAVLQGQ